jgi:hypothetical protein
VVSSPAVPGAWSRELSSSWPPLSLVEPRLQPNQKMMGQDHQRHVVVPTPPEAALVVVQAEFVLALGEAALNRPTHPAGPDQGDQRQVGWRVGQIVFVDRFLPRRGDRAADH